MDDVLILGSDPVSLPREGLVCESLQLSKQHLRMIKIGHREIGQKRAPFVIAEMSGNHNQSLDRALEIVEAAAKTGAHALKIQTYTPNTMTLVLDEREFHISNPMNMLHKLCPASPCVIVWNLFKECLHEQPR